MESFELNGMWWFPDLPNRKMAGILKFDPEHGIVLDIGADLLFTNQWC